MKTVPLKDLKKNLSSLAQEVAKGAVVQVTRHNRPYITLVPSQEGGLCCGTRVGQGRLQPALRAATGGRWLEVLLDDRADS